MGKLFAGCSFGVVALPLTVEYWRSGGIKTIKDEYSTKDNRST